MFRTAPTLLLVIVLSFVTTQQVVSATCTLCYLDEAQDPKINSQRCTDLENLAATIDSENSDECRSVQVDAFQECGCPPVAISTGECSICENDAAFVGNRTVYRDGEDPITCVELQTQAGLDTALCAEIAKYRYYCGCENVDILQDVSCALCGPGKNATPFGDRLLPGLAPDFIPPERYTCAEAQRQVSLAPTTDTCNSIKAELGDTDILCGCSLAPPPENFTTVPCPQMCLEQNLIPKESWNKTAIVNHQDFGTKTCYEFQLIAAQGLLSPRQCNAAYYVGTKHCGCENNIQFCDICEDATPVTPENLGKHIVFNTTCLDAAGDAYFRNPNDELCPAFQNTLGQYCGCDNPIASANACRVCDVPPGEVVPDSSQTLVLDGSRQIDCGELEFSGNNPKGAFNCDQAQLLGVPCCANAPSAAPTVTPETPSPTSAPSQPTTEAPSTGYNVGAFESLVVSLISGLVAIAV